MTAQIPDTIIFREEEFEMLYWKTDHGRFDPRQFGIETDIFTTGLRRGFHCTYRIREKDVVLESFLVRSFNGHYPPVNDVVAQISKQSHAAVYWNVNLPVMGTGTLKFGRDLDPKLHVSVCGTAPCMYTRVHELRLANGRIRMIRDMSRMNAKERAKLPWIATVEGTNEWRRRLMAGKVDEAFMRALRAPIG